MLVIDFGTFKGEQGNMETCAYLSKSPGYAPDGPGAYFGRSFFVAKAPWSSSSLRMKFQTITGMRSATEHWNSG